LAQAGTFSGSGGGLKEALRRARLAEAAHHEAVLALQDARTLRLQLLKDELAPLIAASPEAAAVFDVVLVPGDTPKLWIDHISTVVMEPDPRIYRAVQDTAGGRETLFETAALAEMTEFLKQFMAHRIIARERQIAATGPIAEVVPGFSTGAVLLAWLAGFALGALSLLCIAIYLKIV
jgi:hypothetical protein